MKKKYYYYVAQVLVGRSVAYTRDTIKTRANDFPLLEIENNLSKYHSVSSNDVIITFYKEITEETYKTYNNEQ